MTHQYVSTACQHDRHADCRRTCKWCPANCLCVCHLAQICPWYTDGNSWALWAGHPAKRRCALQAGHDGGHL